MKNKIKKRNKNKQSSLFLTLIEMETYKKVKKK